MASTQKGPVVVRVRYFPLTALLGSLLFFAACAEPGEQSAADESIDPIAAGEIAYMSFCLNCHGEDGIGDGPLTELITVRPTDLTQLSANNDGTFPEDHVRQVIRGTTDEIEGHVIRDMPVWYSVWSAQYEGADQDAEIQQRIDELVAYLKTLQ